MIILDKILELMLMKTKSNPNKEIVLWIRIFFEVKLNKIKILVFMDLHKNIDKFNL